MAEIQIKKDTDTRYKAEVQPGQNEVEAAEKEALKKVRQNKKVPGFRKGKAPDHILKKQYAGEVQQETMMQAISAVIPQIAEESEDGFYELISVDDVKPDEKGVSFTVTFDIPPVVRPGRMKDITIKENIPEITDKDIEKEIDSLRKRFAETEEFENEEVKVAGENTAAVISYEIWVDDAPQGDPVTDKQFILGSGELDEEIDEAIRKKPGRPGDEFTFDRKSEHDGKEYRMIVTLNDVKKVKMPEIDDEWAAKYNSEFTTVDDLKADIRKRLELQFKRKNLSNELDEALQKLTASSEILIPESYVNNKIEEFFKERQVQAEQITEETRKELETAILETEKRRLLSNHLVRASVDRAEGEYRDQIAVFMDEEYSGDLKDSVLAWYDQAVEGRQLDQMGAGILNNVLEMFHQKKIEEYFRAENLVKKGKKIPVYELLSQEK